MHLAKRRTWSAGVLVALAAAGVTWAEPPAASPADAVVWDLVRLDNLGGQTTTVVGAPRVIDTAHGKAVEFSGQGEALFVPTNPLAGLRQFTVEVIFQPAAGGPQQQRFVHFQEAGSENRLLFETRLTRDNRWFLDTFIKCGSGNYTLFAEQSLHEIGPWQHAAIVVDGVTMRHYVNGHEELSTPIRFEPFRAGQTSLGARFNKVSWFKGAIRQIRITPRALAPAAFLTP